jgi:hypothetical protein
MPTLSPVEWKRFYETERSRIGRAGLEAMLERAPAIPVDARHAAIFPHTRLEVTGHMVAAVVRGVIESGADEVLAIGVLHGAPSPERRVHLSGEASTHSEFSLDAFSALLATRPAPIRVHARYPLHVGEDPSSLPGIDEIARLAERMPVVATTDPVHHGVGYGDVATDVRDAPTAIDRQLRALEACDYATFQRECRAARSDFRDVGPTVAHVLGSLGNDAFGVFPAGVGNAAAPRSLRFDVRALELVDYADALHAPPPTWVAAALISCGRGG